MRRSASPWRQSQQAYRPTTKRLTLGKHGKLTPQQARDFAKEKLGEILKGIDVAEHRKEHREKLALLTFAEAVEIS